MNDQNINIGEDYSRVLDLVTKYALAAEKPTRYEHSCRVSKMAERLTQVYYPNNQPVRDAVFLAAIAHDMCKDMPDVLVLSLAQRDRFPIGPLEAEKPSLMHGRAAAMLLSSDFGVTCSDTLEAVRYHTFGFPKMGAVAKLLYVADKIEPGREYNTRVYERKIGTVTLNELTSLVVKDTIDYLIQKKREVSSVSLQFLDSLHAGENVNE